MEKNKTFFFLQIDVRATEKSTPQRLTSISPFLHFSLSFASFQILQ
jgi:hypothetical protein